MHEADEDESSHRAREGERRVEAGEARTALDETGGAPLPTRQEWRRTMQRRTALLQHRRRLGR